MPRVRLSLFGATLLLVVVAACDTSSAPTTVVEQPRISAASARAAIQRHLLTFKANVPAAFGARVKALGGKVALTDEPWDSPP